MKIAAGLLLILVCGIFGCKLGDVYRSEREILEELSNVLSKIKTNFEFSKKPKGELLEQCELSSRLKDVFAKGEFNETELTALPLTEEIKDKVKNYFTKLGEDFADEEKEKCAEFSQYIAAKLEIARKETAKEKACVKVGALLGSLVFILLL